MQKISLKEIFCPKMLDKKDLQILEQLQIDSRMTVKEIAKKTGIRPSTVHKRILKLKQSGVIKKFSIRLDDKAISENLIVFMLVKTKPAVLLDVLKNRHIKEVYGMTGEYDLLLKLKFKDVEEFNNFIIKFRKEQRVEATLTSVVTARIKED